MAVLHDDEATLFTWGGGRNKELGHTQVDREGVCPFPVAVPLPQAPLSVACGEACTAAVTVGGALFTWGCGRGGRLGHGDNSDRVAPTRVAAMASAEVVRVAVGESHALCVIADGGKVFSWGRASHGCLGSGESEHRLVPGPVLLTSRGDQLRDAVLVDAGFNSSVAVTSSGELFAWGSNEHGKLGLGLPDSAEDTKFPQRVTGIAGAVVCASMGSQYAAAVTTDGALFTWGLGSHGNLGHGNRLSFSSPQRVCSAALSEERVVGVHCTVGQINPVVLPQPAIEGSEGPHTAILTQSGRLYTCGTAHKGILGNLRDKTLKPRGCDQLQPYLVGSVFSDHPEQGQSNYLYGVHVVQAVAASIHTAALGSDGRLRCFGCGSSGRLGIRKFMTGLTGGRSRMKCYVPVPTVLEAFDEAHLHVTAISTSRRHMAAIAVPD